MLKSEMRLWRAGSAIVSLALLVGQTMAQDCTYTDTDTFATELLCSHNGYRTRHQAVSLIYNDTMAAAAASYASECIFEHPSLDQQGSNLAAGFSNPYDAVDAWYLEVNDPGYNFSAPGPQDGTLHFTQMVWNTSVQLGCGAYNCNGANNVPGWYIACYYYTEGNVVLYGDPGYFFERNVFLNTSDTVASRFSCPDTPTSCPTTTSSTSTAAATSTVAQGTTTAASSSATSTAPASSGAGNAASTSSTAISSLSTSVASSSTSVPTTSFPTPTNLGGSTLSSKVITSGGTTFTVAPVVPTVIPVGTSTGSGYTNSSAASTLSGLDGTTLITLSSSSSSPSSSSLLVSSSISSSSPSSVSSSSSSTGVVGPAATTVVLAVLVPSSMKKRQTTTLLYLKSDGTLTADSSQAATLTLFGSQLFNGNALFSTNPGTASEIFSASTASGSISTTFALVNNILTWTNSAFTINGNNEAQFAVSASTLFAAFSTLPAGATAVQATAVSVSTTSSTAAGTTTATPTTTASSSSGQFSLSNTAGANYTVITSVGPTSQTVITATQPTTISTDGAVFIIHATGATNANGASGAPTATALPACPTNVVQPSVVRIGGGAVNVIMPDFYGRM